MRQWFETTQAESGALGSDWGMTALAAAGTNAADVRAGLADPSAQDFYLGEWQAEGPGGAGTDAERGILAGVAGGIQTSRLGVSGEVEKSNLVARVAELFDGTQIGEEGLLNDDIFGVLALHEAGAPQSLLRQEVDYLRTKQLPDGGWSWNSSPTAVADTDMTGSVVAAFCAAGVSTADPDLQKALTLLHSLQDPETGGFIAPLPSGSASTPTPPPGLPAGWSNAGSTRRRPNGRPSTARRRSTTWSRCSSRTGTSPGPPNTAAEPSRPTTRCARWPGWRSRPRRRSGRKRGSPRSARRPRSRPGRRCR